MPIATAEIRDPDLLVLRHPALRDDRGVEVLAYRRGPGQRQPGHDSEDRRESHRRDESEEERAPDRIRQMDRCHVGPAEQPRDLVEGAVGRGVEVAGIAHQQRDRAEPDDEGQHMNEFRSTLGFFP